MRANQRARRNFHSVYVYFCPGHKQMGVSQEWVGTASGHVHIVQVGLAPTRELLSAISQSMIDALHA